jgi:hypothetical protein
MDTNTVEGARALADSVQEEFDRIHTLSDEDLHAALAVSNSNLPEKLSDKRAYISELVRRYKED